jgi:hypothetical protein
MTDNLKYHLRLLERFFHYDTITSHSCEWPAGAVVTDPAEIAMLEARHAPTERIIIHTEFKR